MSLSFGRGRSVVPKVYQLTRLTKRQRLRHYISSTSRRVCDCHVLRQGHYILYSVGCTLCKGITVRGGMGC